MRDISSFAFPKLRRAPFSCPSRRFLFGSFVGLGVAGAWVRIHLNMCSGSHSLPLHATRKEWLRLENMKISKRQTKMCLHEMQIRVLCMYLFRNYITFEFIFQLNAAEKLRIGWNFLGSSSLSFIFRRRRFRSVASRNYWNLKRRSSAGRERERAHLHFQIKFIKKYKIHRRKRKEIQIPSPSVLHFSLLCSFIAEIHPADATTPTGSPQSPCHGRRQRIPRLTQAKQSRMH